MKRWLTFLGWVLAASAFAHAPDPRAIFPSTATQYARGFVTSFQYNSRRELTNTIAPTNLTTRISVDAVGNVASTTDARGFTTSNSWSATRKLLATALPSTPQGVPVTTHLYDPRDWLWRTLNPLQQATIFTNDAAQAPGIKAVRPEGSRTVLEVGSGTYRFSGPAAAGNITGPAAALQPTR